MNGSHMMLMYLEDQLRFARKHVYFLQRRVELLEKKLEEKENEERESYPKVCGICRYWNCQCPRT